MRVVVAAILGWVLGAWFTNLIGAFGGALFIRSLGYLIGALVASKIARERAVTAVVPTSIFLVFLAPAPFFEDRELEHQLLHALLLIGVAAACLGAARWLASRPATANPG